jgi:hypothetical protein
LTVLLISATAFIITILLYWRRPLQLILRTLAILLMLVLITNITIRTDVEVTRNNPLILIDYSMSMRTHHADILDRISRVDFEHDLFFSHCSLLTTEKPENPGSYTDLKTTIEQADQQDPAFIVLISDGNHNYGASPLSSAGTLNTPVYIYGVGDENPRNVSIIDVAYPRYAYDKDSIRIEATVESGGFPAGMIDLVLNSAEGKRIAARPLPLSDVPARNTITFIYIASEPGSVQLKLSVAPQPDEISYEDNKYTLPLNILEERIRILYYTDHISFNTKYILRSVQGDPNLSLLPIAHLGSNEYRDITQGIRLTRLPDLADFDVLILDNVDLKALPWRNVPGRLSRGTGILLSGTLHGISKAWLEIMPISVAEGLLHGSHRIEIIEPFSVLTESNNPPVRTINRVIAAKEDAVIVARAGNLPVIGYRMHERGKVFQLAIPGLGLWQFLRSGLKGDAFLPRLIGDIVRSVSFTGQHPRLLLTSKDPEYILGETVNLTLQSYDRDFRPAGAGDFFLVINEERIPFYETKMGQYEATLVAKKIGRYEIFAEGDLRGERLTSNVLDINVSSRAVENEYRMNQELLQRTAAMTGGSFHSLDELGNIELPETVPKTASRTLSFDSPFTYGAVIIFLAIDWIMRRRRGIT